MTDEELDPIVPGIAPLTYLFNARKSVSFLRMVDCWRIILRVPKDVDDESALAPDWIVSRLKAVAPAFERLPNVVMKDIYGVSKRVAARYCAGRACLAGDSAHVTNTRGGMNMNCGIHDAFAVARAIVMALRRKRPDLVAAAAEERRRVATDFLIPRTDRNVAGGQAWLDKVKTMAAYPDKARAYLRTTAMLDMVPAPDDPLYGPAA
jgi:2-polyprenyl-6-methoxyphenol hydroxylase-like FAD-dependent oxidoreductase